MDPDNVRIFQVSQTSPMPGNIDGISLPSAYVSAMGAHQPFLKKKSAVTDKLIKHFMLSTDRIETE